MKALFLLAALAMTPSGAVARDQTEDHIAKLIAATDGSTKEKAFKVKSVDEEYEILDRLKLQRGNQDLIMGKDGHPYDMLTATDPETGSKRELWFDIRSFFGKEF